MLSVLLACAVGQAATTLDVSAEARQGAGLTPNSRIRDGVLQSGAGAQTFFGGIVGVERSTRTQTLRLEFAPSATLRISETSEASQSFWQLGGGGSYSLRPSRRVEWTTTARGARARMDVLTSDVDEGFVPVGAVVLNSTTLGGETRLVGLASERTRWRVLATADYSDFDAEGEDPAPVFDTLVAFGQADVRRALDRRWGVSLIGRVLGTAFVETEEDALPGQDSLTGSLVLGTDYALSRSWTVAAEGGVYLSRALSDLPDGSDRVSGVGPVARIEGQYDQVDTPRARWSFTGAVGVDGEPDVQIGGFVPTFTAELRTGVTVDEVWAFGLRAFFATVLDPSRAQVATLTPGEGTPLLALQTRFGGALEASRLLGDHWRLLATVEGSTSRPQLFLDDSVEGSRDFSQSGVIGSLGVRFTWASGRGPRGT